MKNYSEITESLDITTKQYVDQGLTSKADVNDIPTSIDGLGGGTLTSPMTLTGGDGAAVSKMILTSNGQITNESTATLFGRSGGVLIVGHQSMPLRLRGSATNPVYSKDNQTFKELAFKSDIPAAVTDSTVSGWGFTKLSEADVKGIKVDNATNADVAGKVANLLRFDDPTGEHTNKVIVTYDGSQPIFVSTNIEDIRGVYATQLGTQFKGVSYYLAPTGVAAGTYNSVTVDAKGRVIAGTNTPAVDTSNFAKLDAENTFTKGQVITGGTSDGYSVKASGYVKGSWLQSSVMNNKGANTGMVCVFDGAGWIYYRTPIEILRDSEAFSLSGTTLTITI